MDDDVLKPVEIRDSTIGPVANCEGGGWLDACDGSYAARCDGNVATSCDGDQVRIFHCADDSLCWAKGSRAGCATASGACATTRDGTSCGGGARSNPCCEGFTCNGTRCGALDRGSCEYIFDCAAGLACSRTDGEVPRPGETGTCVAPTCALGCAGSVWNERCDHLPGTPCCIEGMICDTDRSDPACCLPTGAEPINESGAYESARGCDGFDDLTRRCR